MPDRKPRRRRIPLEDETVQAPSPEALLECLPWELQVELSENIFRKDFSQRERAIVQRDLIARFSGVARERQGARTDLDREGGTSTARAVEVVPRGRWKNSTEKVGKIFGEGERTIRERIAVVAAAEKDPDRYGPLLQKLEETGNVRACHDVLKKRRTLASVNSSEEEDWYTPRAYVEAAREVMGGIDLDPASCALANETVRAARFFDREVNGLRQEWTGRVFLNPPYLRLAGAFIAKLLREFEAGRVTEAVVLVNFNSLSNSWAWPLWQHTVCVCRRRINFERPGQAPAHTSNHGSAFIYLGPNYVKFATVFSSFGVIVRRFCDYSPPTEPGGDDVPGDEDSSGDAPVPAPLPPTPPADGATALGVTAAPEEVTS